MIALEGHDEILLVEAERIGHVQAGVREFVPETDYFLHHALAFLKWQQIPRARAHEWVDEKVLEPARTEHTPEFVVRFVVQGILRPAGHPEEIVAQLEISSHADAVHVCRHLLHAVEGIAYAPEHEIAVCAQTYKGVGQDLHSAAKLPFTDGFG